MNCNTISSENKLRICSLCKKRKTLDEYYYNKTHNSYLSQCKSCNNKRSQERRAKFRKNNKEEYLKRRKEYNDATKEQRKADRKRYYENNKHEEYMRYVKRRHTLRKLKIDFTEDDWIYCVDYFNGSCAYCCSDDRLTKDHFIPVNKKGGYTKHNIVPACVSCNCSKKDKDFLDWYPRQEFYSRERAKRIMDYLDSKKQSTST